MLFTYVQNLNGLGEMWPNDRNNGHQTLVVFLLKKNWWNFAVSNFHRVVDWCYPQLNMLNYFWLYLDYMARGYLRKTVKKLFSTAEFCFVHDGTLYLIFVCLIKFYHKTGRRATTFELYSYCGERKIRTGQSYGTIGGTQCCS